MRPPREPVRHTRAPVAAPDLRGRGTHHAPPAADEPIEVVMASAQPKPDFDREWAEPDIAQTTSSWPRIP